MDINLATNVFHFLHIVSLSYFQCVFTIVEQRLPPTDKQPQNKTVLQQC